LGVRLYDRMGVGPAGSAHENNHVSAERCVSAADNG
jgi:hypothetical protein